MGEHLTEREQALVRALLRVARLAAQANDTLGDRGVGAIVGPTLRHIKEVAVGALPDGLEYDLAEAKVRWPRPATPPDDE